MKRARILPGLGRLLIVHAAMALGLSLSACSGRPTALAPNVAQASPESPAPATTAGAPATGRYPARYRLELLSGEQSDSSPPPSLLVRLWLMPTDAERRADLPSLPGRAQRRQHVVNVRCFPGNRVIAPSDTGWMLPGGCERVEYRVQGTPAATSAPRSRLLTFGPSAEQWLVHGASLFLVPEHLEARPILDLPNEASLVVHHALGGSGRLGLRLPPSSALGRVIFSLGAYHTTRMVVDENRFLHHMATPNAAPLEGFEEGLRALHDMAGMPPPSTFHVYWIGVPYDPELRLAGAHGLDSVLVQSWRDLPQQARESTRRAPLAVFYQQYLVALAGPRAPGWLAESLAHYLALLAWESAGAIDERGLQAVIRGSALARPTMTVRAAYARWQETGSEEDYSTFYGHGMGYWSRLDDAIHKANERSGLANISRALLQLVYSAEGSPPARFFALLEAEGVEAPRAFSRGWLTAVE